MANEAFKEDKAKLEKITSESRLKLRPAIMPFGERLVTEGIANAAKSFHSAVLGEPLPGTKIFAKEVPKYGGAKYDYPQLAANFGFALAAIAEERRKIF